MIGSSSGKRGVAGLIGCYSVQFSALPVIRNIDLLVRSIVNMDIQLVIEINSTSEGGKGRADEFIEKYKRLRERN